jgi:hypothetical protein
MNYKTKICLKFNKVEREQKGKKIWLGRDLNPQSSNPEITALAIGTQKQISGNKKTKKKRRNW